jgi:hypothetical protein
MIILLHKIVSIMLTIQKLKGYIPENCMLVILRKLIIERTVIFIL